MQQCGIGNVGANSLLDVIKLNTTIVVLDIRQNDMIGRTVLTLTIVWLPGDAIAEGILKINATFVAQFCGSVQMVS